MASSVLETARSALSPLAAPRPAADATRGPVSPLEVAPVETVVAAIRAWSGQTQNARTRGARRILAHLIDLPGASWADRWLAFEASADMDWRTVINDHGGDPDSTGYRLALTAGLGGLMVVDAVRPSYEWLHGRRFDIYHQLTYHRDRDGTDQFVAELDKLKMTVTFSRQVVNTAAQVQSHTGKSIRQITVEDLTELIEIQRRTRKKFHGLQVIWRILHALGWIDPGQPVAPIHRQRQLTPEEMVDSYNIASPQREAFVEYLRTRSPSVDYTTLRQSASFLLGRFWRDIVDHHSDIDRLRITHDMAQQWKDRCRTTKHGEYGSQYWSTLFAVRAFYTDIASWAITDSYWAPWVAPCPVSRADIRAYAPTRRRQVANMQQRTRNLSGLLPQLVRWVEQNRRTTAATLAQARVLNPGDRVRLDGKTWTVHRSEPRSPLRLRCGNVERLPATEEANGFWTWALVETLRHTGLRLEEVLELTHFAIQPYTVPETGDTIPLLHIVPSKTDEERLIVASPELASVLSEVIHRVRAGQEHLPLTRRYDPHEHQLGDPLPHLFVRPFAKELRVISPGGVRRLLDQAAAGAQTQIHGRPIKFTAHDFRRVFATDALSSGLPPHIVQVLLGHKSLSTTQIYAAIYPQDVIRHHRNHILQRRQTRASEEYREPTAEEWTKFEAHFARRKVSLGSCGRAYGTDCHHEHACLRCALLRPDPDQMDRLVQIIDNLNERIHEAERNGWLGEVDGLKISLAGAESKLTQMMQQSPGHTDQVLLGLPRPPQPRMGGTE